MDSIGVILASGVGRRFEDDVPKQFHLVKNNMVISYVINSLKKSKVNHILVVCGNDYYADLVKSEFNVNVILGGETRNETIERALNFARENNYQKIIFCDSVRPNLKSDYVNECIDLLDDYDAVITTQKITDSLGSFNEMFVNRDDYFLIQTPECFKTSVLDNFDINSKCTAIVQQIDSKYKVYNNYNCKNNVKLTYKEDVAMLESILEDL